MKKTNCCPKCGNKKLYVVSPPCMGVAENTFQVQKISIASAYIESEDGKSFWNSGKKREEATTEAYVCSGCGYTEWYTTGLDILKKLVDSKPAHGGSKVQSIVKAVHGD